VESHPESKRFGRYEIVGELGRGAMGVVYKARDPQIDRLVAIKTVSLWGQEPEAEEEFRLRFSNEAQAAGRLHHPGIVSVFDVGTSPENKDPYIVLEYVSGETLNKILGREKKLPLARALKLAEEIAEALDYAHAQGVVHRDIKPANILVTEDGHAKIADFGIAKLNLAHFTVPGKVLGTPAYMAPEQLSGQGCDGRSDLFSLGVILYAMVTGHSAFQGDSATTVCFKVANREPVAASAFDMTLPPQLDGVICRAIAKNPEERYQTGAEFAEDLKQLQQNYKVGSTTSSLHAILQTGTRSTATRTATGVLTMQAVEDAEHVVRHVLFRAPVRDLMVGAAIVFLLVVIGTQTGLLVLPVKLDLAGLFSGTAVAENPTPTPRTPASASVGQPVETPALSAPIIAAAPRTKVRSNHPRAIQKETVQVLVPSSTLQLSIQHQFKDATLSVWVDGKLALTRPLHGGVQKKLVVFSGVKGTESETLAVPAGNHELRLRAQSTDQTVDLSKSISAHFVGGDEKILQVSFDKRNTMMRLSWGQ